MQMRALCSDAVGVARTHVFITFLLLRNVNSRLIISAFKRLCKSCMRCLFCYHMRQLVRTLEICISLISKVAQETLRPCSSKRKLLNISLRRQQPGTDSAFPIKQLTRSDFDS